MRQEPELTTLEQLIDRIDDSTQDGDRVSLDDILAIIGRRTFGPILLVAGLITLAPVIGDIPGVPTLIGLLVLLVAIQLLLNRRHFWLPRFLLERSVARDNLDQALSWLRPPARFIDRFLRPRLVAFTECPAVYGIALACILIAISMPAMEVIPFSANLAGAALTAFGFSLIARDGLFAVVAFVITTTATAFVIIEVIP